MPIVSAPFGLDYAVKIAIFNEYERPKRIKHFVFSSGVAPVTDIFLNVHGDGFSFGCFGHSVFPPIQRGPQERGPVVNIVW